MRINTQGFVFTVDPPLLTLRYAGAHRSLHLRVGPPGTDVQNIQQLPQSHVGPAQGQIWRTQILEQAKGFVPD